MCGIFFSSVLPQSSDIYIQRTERFISHRGTLTPIVQILDGMLFAHSLLPVQGNSPVQQPLIKENHVLIYSGEMWEHAGYDSDTLFLFDKLFNAANIIEVVRELRGMFGFVYFDADSGSVYFASDIFGEIPLYFHLKFDCLVVASEIKQLVAHGVTPKEIRPALPGFLYSYDTNKKVLVEKQYHTWVFTNSNTFLDRDRLLHLIRESVEEKYRTIDMQQSALLLSGGIDSAILAHELRSLGLKKTFTVAATEKSLDFDTASKICKEYGLEFNPIVAKELIPDCAIATAEISNRSIIEEMCCHIILGNFLRDQGIQVVFTGCGADEIFVGYQHLLRYRNRDTRQKLQEEFVTNYHRMDLRAFNKVYMLNAIEIRNPFLSDRLLEYVATLDVDSLLIGRHREMKIALRLTYSSILGDAVNQPKLIARETMGAKQLFRARYGDSPLIYKQRVKEIFADPDLILDLLNRAKSLS